MKNKIKNGLFLPQVIFTLFGFLTVVSCNKINYRVSYPTTDPNYQPYNGNQVLVWKAPDATTSDFRNDLDSILNRHPGYTAGFCSNCDNNLVIISGPAASQALGPVGQLATGGSGGRPSGPSGGGAGYYWGVNFIVTVNDPIDSSELNDKRLTAIKPTTFSESPVAVAVLDTGVDSAGLRRSGDLYIGTDSSCLNHFAQNGWNFPDNTPAVEDHYHPLQGHGSTVSRLILEEVQAIHKTPVKILPVKIISDHGSAKLFDVLCALAYAKDRGAKIINASFGYYSCKLNNSPVDSGALLFKEFIKYHLTANNILLVAAGGNYDSLQQLAVCERIDRSLDKMHFYPASFASDPEMPNIIAVTTVHDDDVSPLQNFSNSVIDVGVYADEVTGMFNENYIFRNPRIDGGYVEGSSYATPIVTATIAAYYNYLVQNIPVGFNKNSIFNQLVGQSMVTVKPALTSKIYMGKVMHHLAAN